MKKSLAAVVVALMLTTTNNAVLAVQPSTFPVLATCEDARNLARKTRTWRARAKATKNENLYKRQVDYSPTCRWVKKEGKHNSIQRATKSGAWVEILIHKNGEVGWVKTNSSKVLNLCWSFHDQQPIEYLRWKRNPRAGHCALIKHDDGYHMGGRPNE